VSAIVVSAHEVLRNLNKFLDQVSDSSLRKGVYPSQFVSAMQLSVINI